MQSTKQKKLVNFGMELLDSDIKNKWLFILEKYTGKFVCFIRLHTK